MNNHCEKCVAPIMIMGDCFNRNCECHQSKVIAGLNHQSGDANGTTSLYETKPLDWEEEWDNGLGDERVSVSIKSEAIKSFISQVEDKAEERVRGELLEIKNKLQEKVKRDSLRNTPDIEDKGYEEGYNDALNDLLTRLQNKK